MPEPTLLDVRPWYRADVRGIINSLRYMHSCRSASPEYSAGFLDALIALCLSFGIDPKDVGLDHYEEILAHH